MNFLTAYVELKVDDKIVKVKLKDIKKAFEDTARDSEKRFGRMDTAFGDTLNKMLRRVVTWAAAIGGIIKSIKAFAVFEQQILDVSTLLDDKFMPLLPKFSEAVKELAMDFGQTTDSLNKALYDIISATIPPAQALQVLSVSAKAAVAGVSDVGTAAYAIIGIMNAYGQATYKAAQVSDVLFVTVKKGLTTFKELAPAVGRVTTIAASAGIKLEEVGAALATITRGGINTNEAVTVLRMAILSLQGTAEISAESAKRYGITLSAQALRAKGLKGAIEELSKVSPDALKDIIREVRARLAITKLIQDQTGFLEDLNLAYGSAGYTQKAFDKQATGLMFSLRRVGQAIKVVAITLGEAFKVPLKNIADQVTDWVKIHRQEIWKWAQRVSVSIQYVIDIFRGWVTYLRGDWRRGVNDAIQIIIQLFIGLGNIIYAIMKHTFKRILSDMKDWGVDAAKEALVFQERYSAELRKVTTKWNPFDIATEKERAEAKVKAAQAVDDFRKVVDKYRAEESANPLMIELKAITAETAGRIATITGEAGSESATRALRNRMVEIEKEYQRRLSYEKQIAADINQINFEEDANRQEEIIEKSQRTILQHIMRTGEYTRRLISGTSTFITNFVGRVKTSIEKFDIDALFNGMIETVGRAFKKMQDYADEWAVTGEKRWIDFAESIKSPMEGAFEDMIFAGKSLQETMTNIARAIVQEFIKIQFIRPFVGMLSAGVSGLMPAAPAAPAPVAPAAGAHLGGNVGELTNNRLVPVGTFANARKYHGLKTNEQAIIAEKGEVISRGKPSGGDVIINLSAIDTQTGLAFLTKHKRDIAGLSMSTKSENHVSRRNV